MGKVVAGKASGLEVGALEQQAAIFSAERHVFGDIKINAAAVNKSRLGLIVAAALAHADERIIQRIRGTEKDSADSSQPERPHSAAGRRANHRFTRKLMDIGLNIGFTKERIKIFLRIARIAVVALYGEPWIEVIAIANQKAAAPGRVVRDINVGGILGQVHRTLNAHFRLKILGKARRYKQKDECNECYCG